ncbi:2,3-diaminopropionate biosynthesis protein SbnB [Dactylosporangium vinaceum]|uniref:2,3-diaminopropionate biosynthesis protein SbnB n=1 Tax=Dactylosporangium vinaceum TaxID=53362 RepID=A0ABV5M2V5_9ACTN|nr:2,3-diaminopropionate biosynthesis protein SbnB [Dactylosporangium vinaceum]UAB99884.1 2,3-diaminopropionate biosynthesis protein SbnB [Dactylosporangium vinaceum]
MAVPTFAVISGRQILAALRGRHAAVVEIVEAAYRLHGAGDTVNPPSYFLRFPDRPADRIIALPASIGGDGAVDGIKWISSFPGNVASGLPRASGVLILNDPATGYPLACLEASVISASRTAASAALAARRLTASRPAPRRLGIVGAGLIARYVCEFLAGTGLSFDEIGVFDLSATHAAEFAAALGKATVHTCVEDVVRGHDLLLLSTTAGTPHITDPGWFEHRPVVLHLSLRDLSPAVVLAGANIVDDVEHCLRERTSLHLAELETGHRDFVDATLYDVLAGGWRPPPDRTLIFSPFGLGVLDLAVGRHVYDTVRAAGELDCVEDFFHELRRYG